MLTYDFSRLMTSSPDVCDIRTGEYEAANSVTRFTEGGRRDDLLCLQEKGERVFRVAGMEPFVLHEGEMIFIPITTRYTSMSVGGAIRWCFVNFRLTKGGEPLYINEPFRIFKNGSDYRQLMKNIEACQYSPLRVKAAVYTLLAEICENAREEAFRSGGFSSIYEVVTEMERHPEKEFSVREAARLCYLSDTAFRKKFKRYTGGIAPMEYRNRLRIDRADTLLGTDSFTLEKIAYKLGFWDLAHFCRVYKQIRGHTPGQRNREE